jgi:LysM repeat protein
MLSLSVAVVVAILIGCQGPADQRKPIALVIDRAPDWPEGPRREAAEHRMRSQSKQFVRKIFASEAMPTSTPTQTEQKKRAEPVMLVPGQPTRVKAPAWTKGIPEPPRSTAYDLPKRWPIQVNQGESLRVLAKWAGTTRTKVAADNRDTLSRRRWLRAGDRLMLTMSANQKLNFDQSRQNHNTKRLESFFATRYVAQVVVYRINRNEKLTDALRRYGKVPIWLLKRFNQRNFRRLRMGAEVLIPVVKGYDRAQGLPPKLVVVDHNGDPLTTKKQETVEDRLPEALLGHARIAIDDGNVLERNASKRPYSVSRSLLPSYGQLVQSPQPKRQIQDTVPIKKEPPQKLRQVLVKKGETLGHFAKWAKLPVYKIVKANPGLNPDRIFIGTRIKLPLGDEAYADFVMARAGRKKPRAVSGIPVLRQEVSKRTTLNHPKLLIKATKTGSITRARVAKPSASKVIAPMNPRGRLKTLKSEKVQRTGPSVNVTSPPPKSASKPVISKIVRPLVKPVYYTIRPGDIASRIALRCKITMNEMAVLNPGRNLHRLKVSQRLRCK